MTLAVGNMKHRINAARDRRAIKRLKHPETGFKIVRKRNFDKIYWWSKEEKKWKYIGSTWRSGIESA